MKVYKEENGTGTLQQLIFRADEGQTPDEFKNDVKSWIAANYPSMTWAEFVDRLATMEAGRIILNME